jgi:hypothetical protein
VTAVTTLPSLLLLAPTGFWAAWHLWSSGRTIPEDAARAS